jgi:hypothetical protein
VSGVTAEELLRLLAARGITLSEDDVARALPTARFLRRAVALVRDASEGAAPR